MPEIVKEFIKTNQLVETTKQRSIIDFDCNVPDGLPDISSILALDGACNVDEIIAENGKITVNYQIHYKILYLGNIVSEDDIANGSLSPEIKAINTSSSHSITVDMPQISEDSSVFARCALEHIEYSLAGARKISIKSVVKILTDGHNNTELAIPVSISDMPCLQTRSSDYCFSAITECIDTTLALAEASELGGGKPSISTILRSDPSICDITVSKTEDTITVKGNLTVCTLYAAANASKTPEIIESHIPFTHVVPASDPSGDPALTVRSEIKSFRTEIGEDSDGLPRVIDIRADIRFCIVGYTTKCGEMLGDAYSLTKGFSLTETTTEAFIRKDDIIAQFVLKEPLSIEEELPPVKTVVDITGQIGQADITVNNDYIAVDGYVVCSVLYLTDNATRPIVSCKKQIPFSHTIERRGLKENASVPLRLYVSHTSFSLLSPSEMELRIAIAARGEIIEKITFPVISGITDIVDVSDATTGRPSILVYIVQPGDTLWKIAKRYNAPIDALIAINEITEPDVLMPGDKLLISC